MRGRVKRGLSWAVSDSCSRNETQSPEPRIPPPQPTRLPRPPGGQSRVHPAAGHAQAHAPVTMSRADVCTPSALKATRPPSCGRRSNSMSVWMGPCTASWHVGPGCSRRPSRVQLPSTSAWDSSTSMLTVPCSDTSTACRPRTSRTWRTEHTHRGRGESLHGHLSPRASPTHLPTGPQSQRPTPSFPAPPRACPCRGTSIPSPSRLLRRCLTPGAPPAAAAHVPR